MGRDSRPTNHWPLPNQRARSCPSKKDIEVTSLRITQSLETARTPYLAILLGVTAVIVMAICIDLFAPAHAMELKDLLEATQFRGDPVFLAP
jgi:hypothetical protein